MIGIDTNVIVRLIVNDDERQSRAAERFIREHGGSGDPCYVSDVTVIETVAGAESTVPSLTLKVKLAAPL